MSATATQLDVRTADERRFQRVPVILHGRYMLPDRTEHVGATVDISPGGLRMRGPNRGAINDRVVAYLDTIGRVEGKIARQTEDGFAMTISGTARRRDKLATQLTWLANRSELGLPEDRRHERLVPKNPLARLITQSGAEMMVRLIDVSLSGAAFSTDQYFENGDAIFLNQTPARIVRMFPHGVACEFTRPPAPDAFDV